MTRRRKQKHCLDCNKPISKNATRCQKCAAVARWADPEYREQQTKNISEALEKHWQDDDYRKQQEQARSDPEFRREIDAKREAWLQDPSNIQLLSDKAKAQWTDAEYRSRVSRSVSKSIKLLWQNPNYRRNQAAGRRASPTYRRKRSAVMTAWWKKRKARENKED